jgi:hypothetical protein
MSITKNQAIFDLLSLAQDYYKSAAILMAEAQYRDVLPLLNAFFECMHKLTQLLSKHTEKLVKNKNQSGPAILAQLVI